ncbi:hypothetical protein LZK98_06135 [Sphingomonas cannabina]|uniref:DUF6683 family protein n=1 Tax=Sphingomonas cannabina TaxID=2899123 RepID=UPI001F46C13F|nr:DUF6683 family protein [Sphingomonas cannabina]UIJ46526.1 hypothetical protein LZK98_06135 [Sphingomonas cannabina]
MIAPICFASLVVPGAAHAQMISPMLYEGPRISLQNHADRARSTSPSRNMSRPGPSALRPPVAVQPASFRYKPSRERRTANYARFVAKSRANDPQGADNLARLFASTDVVEGMSRPLSSLGLRIDDVADAYAVWWINAWQAGRHIDIDVNRRMAAAVSAQAAAGFASSGMLSTASDATKQEMAESLLVQAALISDAMKQSERNPDLARKVAVAVSQGARRMNVDLAAMTLTDDGFVPANETGEVTSKPGTRPTELARTAPVESGGKPSYALIAAAGGAGLGGMILFGRRMSRKG